MDSQIGNGDLERASGARLRQLGTVDDARVARAVAELVGRGHRSRILLSQDVCTKLQLRKYGGRGFSYLSGFFLPELRRLGLPDSPYRHRESAPSSDFRSPRHGASREAVSRPQVPESGCESGGADFFSGLGRGGRPGVLLCGLQMRLSSCSRHCVDPRNQNDHRAGEPHCHRDQK